MASWQLNMDVVEGRASPFGSGVERASPLSHIHVLRGINTSCMSSTTFATAGCNGLKRYTPSAAWYGEAIDLNHDVSATAHTIHQAQC